MPVYPAYVPFLIFQDFYLIPPGPTVTSFNQSFSAKQLISSIVRVVEYYVSADENSTEFFIFFKGFMIVFKNFD